MKKALSLLLSVIIAITSCLFVPVGASAADAVTNVNLSQKYQKMKGFGASACWWSQDVGGWENTDEIMSLLYSKDSGIGLNIYRYNLGAGSKGDPSLYVLNRRTESFIDADGNYNWDNDANAQKCLASAKSAAGDDLRVTLFCNSAPVIYTKNGKGYCDPVKDDSAAYESNLSADHYEDFAEYCYNCAMYFTEAGYNVTNVSPINEPQYSWRGWYNADGSISANQEGCYYSETDARDLLNVFVEKFDGSELDNMGCKVSMFESGAVEGEDSICAAYVDCILGTGIKEYEKNKKLRKYFDSISTHSYWANTEQKMKAADYLKNYSKYNIAATEYCQMENDGSSGVYDLVNGKMSSGLTIEYGLALAKIIYDDLTILNVNEWDWWTACAYGGYTDGLVYLNTDTHEIQTSKRLWSMGNFSKFTSEGSVRTACESSSDTLKTVSFLNPDGSVSVVFINPEASDVNTSINLSGYDRNVAGYTSYVTDESRDLQMNQSGTSLSDEITIPAKSVTTVVITEEKSVPTTETTTEPTTESTTQSTTESTTQPVQNNEAPQADATTTTVPIPAPTTSAPITTEAKPAGAKKIDGVWVNKKYKKPTISKLTKAKKSFKITWKKVSGVSGYQIQYATDKKFKKSKKTVTVKGNKSKKPSKTIKKLKAKKKYYVRVRTYKTVKVNGKATKVYSSWSKTKSVKTK